MITKEQAIVILEAALANPNYLGTSEQGVHWFCSCVMRVCEEVYQAGEVAYQWGVADEIQSKICDDYIYPSIEGNLFLRSYLIAKGAISQTAYYEDAEYKAAAHAHWQALIDKLKSEV